MPDADLPRTTATTTRAPAFPDRRAFVLTSLGYALLNAWSQVFFSDRFAAAAQEAGSSILTVHAVGSALAALTALAVVLLAVRDAPARGRRVGPWVAALLIAVATVGTVLAGRGACGLGPGLVMPLNALACAASVLFSLAWLGRVATLGVKGALACFGAAAVVGSVLYFAAMAAPLAVSDALLAAFPLLSAALLRAASEQPAPRGGFPQARFDAASVGGTSGAPVASAGDNPETPGTPGAAPIPWQAFVPLVVIVGLANYANGTFLNLALAGAAPGATSLAGLAADSVTHMLTVLAAVGLAALGTGARTRMAFCLSILCVLAASLLTFVWEQAPIQPLDKLVHVGVELMGFLAVAALVALVQSGRAPATLLFSVYLLCQFCGTFVGQISSTVLADNRPLTALLLMAVLVVMLLLAFLSHDVIARPAGTVGPAAGSDRDALPETPTAPTDPLRALADEHGLSPRELDVARLWVAGHNSAFIEETLGISKYTVRTHLKNIYAKTGTANKEELIRLAEDSRARG